MALPLGPVWIAVSSTSLSAVDSGEPSSPRGQRVCASSRRLPDGGLPCGGLRIPRGDLG